MCIFLFIAKKLVTLCSQKSSLLRDCLVTHIQCPHNHKIRYNCPIKRITSFLNGPPSSVMSFVCLSQLTRDQKILLLKENCVTKRNIIWKLQQFIRRKKEESNGVVWNTEDYDGRWTRWRQGVSFRDTEWKNLKSATMKKVDSRRPTGSGRGLNSVSSTKEMNLCLL